MSAPVSPASSTSRWVQTLNVSAMNEELFEVAGNSSFSARSSGHETAPAQSQQIEATFVPVGAGRPLTAALLAALQDHGNDTCNPCVFFNSAQGCRHGRMCAYCHLEHPKISQPRPRKVTRDKIKTRIEECLQGPADQVHVSLQEEALGHAYARSLIRGYLDDMAEPKEDPQHVVHLFL
mmetsp:Transcript_66549/g.145883  ORF Transcript_66549/g.145883 Transcript_66549/m.145883 type:complete len:179 (-) Transcript_66549:82-618(-)